MTWVDFHFIRPFWLLALIPFLTVLTVLLRNKLNRGNWAEVCDAELLPYLLQEKTGTQSRLLLIAGSIAAFLVIIALAGPTWEKLPSPVFRNDSALVIALDLSRSMDAEDIKPSRLTRARYKVADILKVRKDGQTALLVYAGDAFTVTPLTDDTQTIDSQLEALNTDIMPSQGSNAAAVIDKAVNLFKQAGLQKGQIILITDGVDLDKALPQAKALDGYSLSVLGVGTSDGAPIAVPEGGFLKDEQGNIVVAKLIEADLMTLAQAGNGIYQTIKADDSDIKNLLSTLELPVQQQGKENTNLLLDQWSDKGPWLLLVVLPFAALLFRKGVLCFALLLLLPLPKNSQALEWQDLWKTKDQQAQAAYDNKDYDKAAQLFKNPDWKAAAHYKAGHFDKALDALKNSKSGNAAYNQGNALAQSGHLEEAIEAYNKALSENAQNEDAKYNKALVEKELKKQQQEKNQQKKEDNNSQQPKPENSDQNTDKQGEKDKSQQSEEQKKNENNSDEHKQSESEKPSEQLDQAQQSEEKKAEETEQAKQAEQPKENNDNKSEPKQAKPIDAQKSPTDEVKQANEQWLKRIPDDPAGLLKRKFRYQYGQRQNSSNSEAGSW
jgi:Ca-activated chloride channel homolog